MSLVALSTSLTFAAESPDSSLSHQIGQGTTVSHSPHFEIPKTREDFNQLAEHNTVSGQVRISLKNEDRQTLKSFLTKLQPEENVKYEVGQVKSTQRSSSFTVKQMVNGQFVTTKANQKDQKSAQIRLFLLNNAEESLPLPSITLKYKTSKPKKAKSKETK